MSMPASPAATPPAAAPAPSATPAPATSTSIASPLAGAAPSSQSAATIANPSNPPIPGAELAPPVAGTRPQGLDDRFWDDKANSVRWEPLNSEMTALRAFKAESDIRLQGVPKAAGDYKIDMTGVEVPAGVKLNFNEADPALKGLREWANKNAVPQAQFNDLIKIEAGREIARHTKFQSDIAAERTKLGENGSARIEAVTTALKGRLGAQANPLIAGLVSSEQVIAYENLLRSSIAPPPGPSGSTSTKPDTSKMSTIEKLHNARNTPQRRSA